MTDGPTTDPARLDRADPETRDRAAAAAYRNWGRWGEDDRLGTRTSSPTRTAPARPRSCGGDVPSASRSASTRTAPRTAGAAAPTRCTPCSTPASTPSSATQGFPHGIGGADDVVVHAAAGIHAVGRPRPHLRPRQGLERPPRGRTSSPARATRSPASRPSPTVIAGRGVLLDVGRRLGEAASCPTASRSPPSTSTATIAAQGASAQVGRGDLLLVRTGAHPRAPGGLGRLRRRRRAGAVVHHRRLAARARDRRRSPPTRGASRCGRTSSTWPSSRCTRSRSRTSGLFIGELWDLDELAADCAADGVWEFLLAAAPIP